MFCTNFVNILARLTSPLQRFADNVTPVSACDVGILTETLEVAVSAHAQYKFSQNSTELLVASSCNASQLSPYLVSLLFHYYDDNL